MVQELATKASAVIKIAAIIDEHLNARVRNFVLAVNKNN